MVSHRMRWPCNPTDSDNRTFSGLSVNPLGCFSEGVVLIVCRWKVALLHGIRWPVMASGRRLPSTNASS